MKIKDIMTNNVITSQKDEKIYEVANKMKEYNIGFIPVIDNSKVIGVITDRDIVIDCISNNNDKYETIDNYINKSIITIDLENSITDALNIMSQNKVKRLLVIDNKKVVGILSLADILTTDLDNEILPTIKNIWLVKDNNKIIDSEIDDFYL